MVYFRPLALKLYSSGSVFKVVTQPHQELPRMPSSVTDYSNTYFETSSKAFSRSRTIVAEQDLYLLLRTVVGATVCISVNRPDSTSEV